jgi:post-segregation antitoxin (ccd killing protein)
MSKTKYIRKTITIREDQEKFIQSKSINLSRFVQKKIDAEMK